MVRVNQAHSLVLKCMLILYKNADSLDLLVARLLTENKIFRTCLRPYLTYVMGPIRLAKIFSIDDPLAISILKLKKKKSIFPLNFGDGTIPADNR